MLLRVLRISLLILLLSSVAYASMKVPRSTDRSSASNATDVLPGTVTLDFADVPLADVARTLSQAYGISILTDDAGDMRVTFHLEGVGLFEGLTALCAANGLAVVQEGRVYHIRR